MITKEGKGFIFYDPDRGEYYIETMGATVKEAFDKFQEFDGMTYHAAFKLIFDGGMQMHEVKYKIESVTIIDKP